MSEQYRRIVVPRRGPPGVMVISEGNVPEPGPRQVRVRMMAAGVSAMDLMVRRFSFPGFPKTPFTPGVDIVGVVDGVGAEVTEPQEGQMVAALLGDEGGYAEFAQLPAEKAVPLPSGVDPSEAVCIAANYLTAYTMMHRVADVASGERVLIHGAAGGVGSALLELGGMAGLGMYATASPHNHELVASMGATPIDYRHEDFVSRIRELTGDGVDVVFDPIGGARQIWRSYRTLRKGGRLVWFGVAATSRRGVRVIPASLTMQTILSLIPDGKKAKLPPDSAKPVEWYRETMTTLLDYLAAGKINPVVADRIPLGEAVRAHELLEHGGHAGKIVLVPGT